MDFNDFIKSYNNVKANLLGLTVSDVFNSIGSNITFQFGEVKDVFVSKKGIKTTSYEWSLRIGNSAWRLSKNENYLVGSEDDQDLIQISIEKLLGKRLKSFNFISQFLDVEFDFDDGYKLVTFFNWFMDDQWTLLLPNDAYIGADCINYKEIRQVLDVAKNFSIIEDFQEFNFSYKDVDLNRIIYKNYDHPIFHFENHFFLDLRFCLWRLERGDIYLCGYTDLVLSKNKSYLRRLIDELMGKKIKKIKINNFKDAIFYFEDQFVLKTFSGLRSIDQWRIYNKENPFYAKITLSPTNRSK